MSDCSRRTNRDRPPAALAAFPAERVARAGRLARAARTIRLALTWLALASVCIASQAWDLAGDKTVRLHGRDGQAVTLGQVGFTPQADGRVVFKLALEAARFKDYFLSMREFKCVDGQGEVLCHVPYPYAQPGTVTLSDLGWLEHSLLFMFKTPTEFGAKLWNGVYFQLRVTEHGLEGRPQAIDLNRISAPSDEANVPPYRTALRDDMAPNARWFSRLTIE